jgi:hypothetical protein
MDTLEQLKGDLGFVRAVVDKADRQAEPTAIYFLWAIVGFCGFALVDFGNKLVPFYWTIAGPAGFLVSAYIGWRYARLRGQMTASAGLRHVLHWGGMLTAVFLAVLIPANGLMEWDGLGPAILLILALSYFQAGVHLDRALLWIGLLMGGGYVFVLLIPAYAWTVVGLVFAASLTLAGLRGGRPNEATA